MFVNAKPLTLLRSREFNALTSNPGSLDTDWWEIGILWSLHGSHPECRLESFVNIPLRYHVIICMLAAHLKKKRHGYMWNPWGSGPCLPPWEWGGGEEGVGFKGIWLCHNKSHVIPPLGSVLLFCLPFIGSGLAINSLQPPSPPPLHTLLATTDILKFPLFPPKTK